ncbi:MAG: hypothetical protein R3E91_05585 [Chlamydiales bacterium]
MESFIATLHHKSNYIWLLLLLPACIAHKEWSYSQTSSTHRQWNSHRILHRTKDPINGINVELLKGAFGTVVYLTISAHPIPLSLDGSNQVPVVFLIEQKIFSYKATRMRGGQKFLLSEEATEKLISSLENHQNIHIYLDRYQTDLLSSNFFKLYKK